MSAIISSPTSRPATKLLSNGTFIVFVIFVVLLGIYAVTQPGALSTSDIRDQLNNTLPLALAAAGGTLVVLTRGFDLSVAGVVALADVLVATQTGEGPLGALAGLGIVLAVGLVVGAINGYLVAYLRLQSIASTLATMIICSGIALLVLDAPGGTVSDFISYSLTGAVGDVVPVAAIIAGVVLIGWLLLRRTNWGHGLYAVGADETAAALAGVATRRVKFLAYVLAGMLYGVAGMMLCALTANGDPNVGTSYLLVVFAAIAIGGTTFSGGRGGIAGTLIGAATLTLLQKVLFSVGVSSFYTGIGQGIAMIIAVLVGGASSHFARGGRS